MPAAKKTTASRSGNPAKRASASAGVTSVADIKKKRGGLLELPSGIVVKAHNPGGMRIFLETNVIPNSLMGIVQGHLDKGPKSNPTEEIADQIVGPDGVDEDLVRDMLHMLNVVATKTIVEPEVHMPPEDEADRDDDLLYADELEDEDKMFLFQWVTGGTRDLEQFRSQLQTELVSLDGRAAMASETKRAPRTRKR